MNQTFYFPRWWMLVTRHWAENRRRFLLSLLAVGALLLAWYGFVSLMERKVTMYISQQFVTYYVGLFFAGCIYASTIFSPLGNKKEAIQYLSVPASQLEKFLCALFYAVFLFFALYTLVFYLVDLSMINMIRIGNNPPGIFNVFSNEGSVAAKMKEPVFLLIFLAVQSAFILGSIYFTRYAFIKTVVALLVFSLLCILFVAKVVSPSLPQGWSLGGLLEWIRFDNGQTETIASSHWIGSTLTWLVEYSIPFIFWYIAYIRLKEKEV